jgi:hypothetical protein
MPPLGRPLTVAAAIACMGGYVLLLAATGEIGRAEVDMLRAMARPGRGPEKT